MLAVSKLKVGKYKLWKIPDIEWVNVGVAIGLEPDDKAVFEYLVGHLNLDITKLTRLAILHYLHCDKHDPAVMEIINRALELYRGENAGVNV